MNGLIDWILILIVVDRVDTVIMPHTFELVCSLPSKPLPYTLYSTVARREEVRGIKLLAP